MHVDLEIKTDASAAIGICKRGGIGKVLHLAVGQLWVQERLKAKEFKLYKVAGAVLPADLLLSPRRDPVEKPPPREELCSLALRETAEKKCRARVDLGKLEHTWAKPRYGRKSVRFRSPDLPRVEFS